MSPDRGHLHHRLLDMGFSQKQTVAILYTLTAVLCLTAVVISVKGYLRGVFLIIAVMVIILASLRLMSGLRDPSRHTDYYGDYKKEENTDYTSMTENTQNAEKKGESDNEQN